MLSGCNKRTAGDSSDQPPTSVETQPTIETQPPVDVQPPANVQPTGYEIFDGFAKTPSHYYSKNGEEMVRAPVDNLNQQQKIPLPENYEGIRLVNAEICGITEDWLFVNFWEYFEKIRDPNGYEYEVGDVENRMCITFRIAMESWEAEAVKIGRYDMDTAPWYNPASDSLLIPYIVKNNGSARVINFEYMPLTTRKTAQVFVDGKPLSIVSRIHLWINALDNRAVFEEQLGEKSEHSNFYVFDEQNKVQLKTYDEMSFVEYFDEVPQITEAGMYIGDSVISGEFVYYLQYSSASEWKTTDLYRVKADGTGQELVRTNTNIKQLNSVKDTLFCMTYTTPQKWDAPDDEEHEIEMRLLNNDGELGKVLFRYIENPMGNSTYWVDSYDGKVMVRFYRIYSSSTFTFLYDIESGASFPVGVALGN